MNASYLKSLSFWATMGAAVGAAAGVGMVYYSRKKKGDDSDGDDRNKKNPGGQETDEAIAQKLDVALDSLEELKSKVESTRDALSAIEKRRSRMRLLSPKENTPSDYNIKGKELSRSTYLYLVASAKDLYHSSSGSDGEHDGAKDGIEKTSSEYQLGPDEGSPLPEEEMEEMRLLLEEIDRMHITSIATQKEAFDILLKYKLKFSSRPEYCWRLLRAYSDMVQLSDEKTQPEYIQQGKEEGDVAVSMFKNNPLCHQWYAIVCGYMVEIEDKENSEKDKQLVVDHINKAIELSPNDPVLYCLLGRWMYGRFLYLLSESGSVDNADENTLIHFIEEALKNLLKAKQLKPGHSKSNQFYIAKCLWILGRIEEAFNWLESALRMPIITEEDNKTHEELKELLTSMKRVLT
ncbi:regulator of microtubule dynamics protein 3-like isoform X2 [Ambystoma mexicanum]|uniref:regulator of microtubule dynamics protein 3-like isoform X2 n=1 Tax=Ambystoma mexicanum TaxID=8296 RepID=UPI0037E8DBBD